MVVAKLTQEIAEEIRKRRASGSKLAALAETFKVVACQWRDAKRDWGQDGMQLASYR